MSEFREIFYENPERGVIFLQPHEEPVIWLNNEQYKYFINPTIDEYYDIAENFVQEPIYKVIKIRKDSESGIEIFYTDADVRVVELETVAFDKLVKKLKELINQPSGIKIVEDELDGVMVFDRKGNTVTKYKNQDTKEFIQRYTVVWGKRTGKTIISILEEHRRKPNQWSPQTTVLQIVWDWDTDIFELVYKDGDKRIFTRDGTYNPNEPRKHSYEFILSAPPISL